MGESQAARDVTSAERENAGGERKRQSAQVASRDDARARREPQEGRPSPRHANANAMAETHSTEAVRTLVMNDELPTQYGKPHFAFTECMWPD